MNSCLFFLINILMLITAIASAIFACRSAKSAKQSSKHAFNSNVYSIDISNIDNMIVLLQELYMVSSAPSICDDGVITKVSEGNPEKLYQLFAQIESGSTIKKEYIEMLQKEIDVSNMEPVKIKKAINILESIKRDLLQKEVV